MFEKSYGCGPVEHKGGDPDQSVGSTPCLFPVPAAICERSEAHSFRR
jgi:hypothetical protein